MWLGCAHSSQVRQQLRKTGTGAPWTASVLARAEQERRLALLAREAVAQHVRDGALGASSTGETVPSTGLPSLKAPWKSSEMHSDVHLCCVHVHHVRLDGCTSSLFPFKFSHKSALVACPCAQARPHVHVHSRSWGATIFL